jgi:hypothetical protein
MASSLAVNAVVRPRHRPVPRLVQPLGFFGLALSSRLAVTSAVPAPRRSAFERNRWSPSSGKRTLMTGQPLVEIWLPGVRRA